MATNTLEKPSTAKTWRPLPDFFSELESFWNLMPGSFFSRPFRLTVPDVWAPRIDFYQKNNSLVLKADLAGIDKDDIDVTVEEGNLIIRGERKEEKEIKEEDYYRCERSFGSFYRAIPLPADISSDDIKANFKNGVLEVAVPLPSEAAKKATQVQIR